MPAIPHVAIIHGLADVSKSWNRLEPLLREHGFIPFFFEYPTFKNDLNIPTIAAALENFVHQRLGFLPFQIVAHSQGGLIAEWYDHFFNTGVLRRITTIGTPFHGNALPLLAPRGLIRHLPFSKQQVKGLGCFSGVIQKLLEQRIKNPGTTDFTSFIGISGKLLGIEGDRLVSACEANRNAIMYQSGKLIATQKPTALIYMKKSHWPLSYVRSLGRSNNEFATRLLLALNGRPQPCSVIDPTQSALIIREGYIDSLTGHEKAILNKRTWDKNFRLMYFTKNMEIKIAGQNIDLQPGRFTYYL